MYIQETWYTLQLNSKYFLAGSFCYSNNVTSTQRGNLKSKMLFKEILYPGMVLFVEDHLPLGYNVIGIKTYLIYPKMCLFHPLLSCLPESEVFIIRFNNGSKQYQNQKEPQNSSGSPASLHTYRYLPCPKYGSFCNKYIWSTQPAPSTVPGTGQRELPPQSLPYSL